MIKLKHNIVLQDAHYVKNGVACVYLMCQGDEIAIIETGTAYSVPHILKAIDELGYAPSSVRYIIPTHIHLDHAGGAGQLMAACPGAQLLIHPRGAAHMIDPGKLQAGTIAVYGDDQFHRLYGELLPVPAQRVVEMDDGQQLDFNGRLLSFLHTAGHALHHFCIHDSLSNGIFTGDTFGICYPNLQTDDQPFIFATTTPVHFSPDDMLASIDRLMALKPSLMYLTHFGQVAPTATLVSNLKKSVLVFKELALKHQQIQGDRQSVIEDALMNWLLETLGAQPNSDAAKWLANDAHLNAQGLEVWLKRMER